MQLIIQVMFFSELIYIIQVISGNCEFSIKTGITMLIPSNYFVILYSVLYLISPLINYAFDALNNKTKKDIIVLVIILFSLWPFLVDVLRFLANSEFNGLSSIGMLGSQEGYTIVNFSLMYIIGLYLRDINIDKLEIKTSRFLIGLLLVLAVISGWSFWNEKTAWNIAVHLLF